MLSLDSGLDQESTLNSLDEDKVRSRPFLSPPPLLLFTFFYLASLTRMLKFLVDRFSTLAALQPDEQAYRHIAR
jgi:hypothetical protein